MKFSKLVIAFGTVLLLLPLSAFAEQGHINFTLINPARVGAKTLKAGRYKMEWNGQGQNVSVDIMRSGKTVATAQGALVPQKYKSQYNAVDIHTAKNSAHVINGFYFHNRRNELVLHRG
jgi:hypothetical protein